VEDLIGENILCWNTVFWIKEANSPSYVGWHQDLQYWGLDNNELVSVWFALSPATIDSGCMNVIPGSHKQQLGHRETYHENNMLTRGQEIDVVVGDQKTVPMPLNPGQVSLHNVKCAHGSGPNKTDDRRIGLSLHYMPTYTKQMNSEWDSAALVRGTDQHNNFVHAPRPTRDFDPETVAFHKRASDTVRQIVYKDAEKQPNEGEYRPTL
jgi:ectoine hydroxylase-related dioxygenase (phytanoyl-CoA dioxygenase family)